MEADRIDNACSYGEGLENVLIKAQASNSGQRDGGIFFDGEPAGGARVARPMRGTPRVERRSSSSRQAWRK